MSEAVGQVKSGIATRKEASTGNRTARMAGYTKERFAIFIRKRVDIPPDSNTHPFISASYRRYLSINMK